MTLTKTLEASMQDYEAEVVLSQDCKDELQWWISNMSRWNGKTMMK